MMFSSLEYFLFFVQSSLKNLTYLGICCTTPSKGRFISTTFKISRSSSSLALFFPGGLNFDGKGALATLFKGFEEEEVHFEEEVECESTLSFLTRKRLLDLCKVVFELGVFE